MAQASEEIGYITRKQRLGSLHTVAQASEEIGYITVS
jgi:hypothetical protein